MSANDERIAGAGVNVYNTEPVEATIRFVMLNVVATPHISYCTKAAVLGYTQIVENINWITGAPIRLLR